MQIQKLKPLFIATVGLLAVVGTVLAVASYFYGLLFILAAVVLLFLYRLKTVDRETYNRQMRQFLMNLAIPLLGIAIAIIIGGVIMALTGYDPITAYAALFYGGFVRNWHVSILNSVPLIFTGLSVAFAFKAGLFNIGAEGQYYVGAMVAAYLGITMNLPPFFSIMIIFFVSGLVAAAYNFIPALLKVKTGAHEVITTMMFAHIARFSSSIFIRAMGGSPDTSKHPYVTDPILESNWLPMFNSFLPKANYRLHMGILAGILMALFVYYVLFYTKFGFEIRAVGHNPLAAKAQGISSGKNIFRALLFAGFLSGLAGFNQVLGLDHKLFENLSAGYGWNGISVALLASNHPIGVVFTSILWGALDAGGQYMARTQQTPNSIVEIIKGIILFLVVARYIYAYIGNRIRRRRILRVQEQTS
ncbi:MAG TPA: ABC transporter permease [Spirochaetia bacterium]|nr:ABC transporter permease [Spirochaetia bacterium]